MRFVLCHVEAFPFVTLRICTLNFTSRHNPALQPADNPDTSNTAICQQWQVRNKVCPRHATRRHSLCSPLSAVIQLALACGFLTRHNSLTQTTPKDDWCPEDTVVAYGFAPDISWYMGDTLSPVFK